MREIVIGLLCAGAMLGASAEKPLALGSVQLLSERGSTRAARYAVSNKIVTLGGKTHVAWLDSISQTMVATYDRGADAWGDAVKVGDGADNHGGPALTCDSEGFLHIVFGPHTGPFQYCRSARPNDAAAWVKQPEFGDHATYPSMVCDDADTLHIIYRGGDDPRKLLYQRKAKGGAWSAPRILVHPDIKSGYTHYHSALTIAPDDSLHISYDIYRHGAAKCAGHMMSRDHGDTWTLADGSALALPVTPKSEAFFKRVDTALKTAGIVCDSKGRPWITVSGPEVWHHDGAQWRCIVPRQLLPALVDAQELSGVGPPALDVRDRLYVPAMLGREVVMLYSIDQGASFQLLHVFPPDETLPHTGLNMERPTGHHVVEIPWLLFSTGEKGPDCFGEGIFHKVRAVRLTW